MGCLTTLLKHLLHEIALLFHRNKSAQLCNASKNRHSIEENCERNIIMVIICNFILLLFWSSHISSVFLIYLTSIFLIKRTGLPAATATGGTSLVTTHSTKRCPNNVMY